MVEIEIMPATRGDNGFLQAKGHAGSGPIGQDLVCCAVSTLFDALEANLRNCWSIHVRRKEKDGEAWIVWNKADRKGESLQRANQAAGFTYTALKELSRSYPENVKVRWIRRERKEEA